VIDAPVGTGWYVYGVTRSGGPRPLVRDAEYVESGSLAAVTRRVSLDEFGEDALKENLNDRAWLEANARAHEEVLLSVTAITDVVPFRFGTICVGLDEVRSLLDERRGLLEADLEHVRGRVELGVKLWVDRDRLTAALAPSPAAGEKPSGRAYLEARRAAVDVSASARAVCGDVARNAYERLARRAVAAVANRPQPAELTGRSEEMALNAAFLVEVDDRTIAAEVAELNLEHEALGLSFELTGPWPPHNFVTLEDNA
jgi:hypothetical protein